MELTDGSFVVIAAGVIVWLSSLLVIVWTLRASFQDFIIANKQVCHQQEKLLKALEDKQGYSTKEVNEQFDELTKDNQLHNKALSHINDTMNKIINHQTHPLSKEKIKNISNTLLTINETINKMNKNSKTYGKSLNNINNKINKAISNQKIIENTVNEFKDKKLKINNKSDKKFDEYTNVMNDKIMKIFNMKMKTIKSASSKAEKKANKKKLIVDIKKFTDSFDGISFKIENILKILKLENNCGESLKEINKKLTLLENKDKDYKDKHLIANRQLNKLQHTLSKLHNIKNKNMVNENITVDNEQLSKSLNIILKKLNTIMNIINTQSIKCISNKNKKEIDNKINKLMKPNNESVEPTEPSKKFTTDASTNTSINKTSLLSDASDVTSASKSSTTNISSISINNKTDNVIPSKNELNIKSKQCNNIEYVNDQLYNSNLLIKNILEGEMNILINKLHRYQFYERLDNYPLENMLDDLRYEIIDIKYGIEGKINTILKFIGNQTIFQTITNKNNTLLYDNTLLYNNYYYDIIKKCEDIIKKKGDEQMIAGY